MCPRSKRKTTRAINTKLGIDVQCTAVARHVLTLEVKRSKVKVAAGLSVPAYVCVSICLLRFPVTTEIFRALITQRFSDNTAHLLMFPCSYTDPAGRIRNVGDESLGRSPTKGRWTKPGRRSGTKYGLPAWHSTTPTRTPTPTSSPTSSTPRIVARMSACRCRLACHRNNFRKSHLSDVSARILARMSLSVSASWNASYKVVQQIEPMKSEPQSVCCACVSFLKRRVVVEQGLTSHQTHYRSYRGRVLWVKRPNQQCQSTEGREVLRTGLQSH